MHGYSQVSIFHCAKINTYFNDHPKINQNFDTLIQSYKLTFKVTNIFSMQDTHKTDLELTVQFPNKLRSLCAEAVQITLNY